LICLIKIKRRRKERQQEKKQLEKKQQENQVRGLDQALMVKARSLSEYMRSPYQDGNTE
jgi:hypothetical protein